VVARDESELDGLDELAQRGEVNGVTLESVNEVEARELEPRARTFCRALFSPTTSSIDPVEVMTSLVRDAERAEVSVLTETPYLARKGDEVRTGKGLISAGYVINAAGLYADRIARDYGFSTDYRILPFKGLYLYEASGRDPMRRHVYPVPELRYPFLGVHFTVTALGKVKIGPTAIPAFWRENYEGLQSLRVDELLEVSRLELELLIRNSFDFRTLAIRELRKHSKGVLTSQASELVNGLVEGSTWTWGRPGIRAQLVNIRERKLEMDFAFEGDDRSCHVLNAVSPAFTCAMPFASYMVDRILEFTGREVSRSGAKAVGTAPAQSLG
jgi:L-2-hydroxyglutarate oxidase LhgO